MFFRHPYCFFFHDTVTPPAPGTCAFGVPTAIVQYSIGGLCSWGTPTAENAYTNDTNLETDPLTIEIIITGNPTVSTLPCAFDAYAVVVYIIYPTVPGCEFGPATAERVWGQAIPVTSDPLTIEIVIVGDPTIEIPPCNFPADAVSAVVVDPNPLNCEWGPDNTAVVVGTPDLCIIADGIAIQFVGSRNYILRATTVTFTVNTNNAILLAEKDKMLGISNGETYLSVIATLRPPATYGLLYNYYAIADSRFIANTGWHVPTEEDWIALEDAIGVTVAANRLKQQGNDTWNIPNQLMALDDVGFTSLGAGERTFAGVYQNRRIHNPYWTNTPLKGNIYTKTLACDGASIQHGTDKKEAGRSLRLVRDVNVYFPGMTYTGNDGKIYRTTQIGSQVWLAEDLAETKFRNKQAINIVGDKKSWSKLSTAAACPYNNNMAPIKT